MTEQDAKTCFDQIFVAFPSVRSWLKRTESPRETYAVWLKALAHVDADDGQTIVDQLISGELPFPPGWDRDRLPQIIRTEANALRSQRNERRRMTKLSRAANEPVDRNERFPLALHAARVMGDLVRRGKLDLADNDRNVAALQRWNREGGPPPEFLRKFV